ncbi:MAG: hypothetical protein IH985_08185 [Planctomycetes bacterium]|nr:hypothetical protein [Planctomycetota bacterium]
MAAIKHGPIEVTGDICLGFPVFGLGLIRVDEQRLDPEPADDVCNEFFVGCGVHLRGSHLFDSSACPLALAFGDRVHVAAMKQQIIHNRLPAEMLLRTRQILCAPRHHPHCRQPSPPRKRVDAHAH